MGEIWFWQRMVTPHMALLASELASLGLVVTYVAEQSMSSERLAQGWVVPDLLGVNLRYAKDPAIASKLAAHASVDSVHLCQGIRANGCIGQAQEVLKARGLRQWVVMEAVDDDGWRGTLKRLVYRRLFAKWRRHIRGVMAIGLNTSSWVVAHGVKQSCVFPFAYFLDDFEFITIDDVDASKPFRFLFVGNFIERKKIDLLLSSLSLICTSKFELLIVGSGPLELSLKDLAERNLPRCVRWIGCLPSNQVWREMVKADCLVLPSRHDGWGAVISEAMLCGTPVICSDACGAAGVVHASGKGGVFKAGDRDDLKHNLERMIELGRVKKDDRLSLSMWARCLGAKAGASYLLDILKYDAGSNKVPMPPWNEKSSKWAVDA